MPLDEGQAKKVNAWMTQKGVRNQCESCGHNNWAMGDIIAAPVFTPGAIQIGGKTVPMLQMICANCGHVRLYAAVVMGIAS